MKKTNIFLDLFLLLFKIGLFTFGGGYAMIALLENEFVEKKRWLNKNEFLDIVAIAESTPGPIAINMATYIGYKKRGVLGSVVATLAICLPSFLIIYIISLFLDSLMSYPLVAGAFQGVRVAVIYLVFSAGMKMLSGMKKDLKNILPFAIVLCCMIVFFILSIDFSSIFYILICGAVGIVSYLIGKINRGEGNK